MTPSQLKFHILSHNFASFYFSRDTMKFFGDTMQNYKVIEHTDKWELARRKPVKHGRQSPAFFSKSTYQFLYTSDSADKNTEIL